jgi:hypothetical protein
MHTGFGLHSLLAFESGLIYCMTFACALCAKLTTAPPVVVIAECLRDDYAGGWLQRGGAGSATRSPPARRCSPLSSPIPSPSPHTHTPPLCVFTRAPSEVRGETPPPSLQVCSCVRAPSSIITHYSGAATGPTALSPFPSPSLPPPPTPVSLPLPLPLSPLPLP